MTLSVISLFSGGGGLDLGFEKAGFKIVWANDYDKQVIKTYKKNNPNVLIDDRSLDKIKSDEIPSSDGIIGGPPCQSWSIAGSNKGLKDKRGKVFLEYLRIINDKNPKFFVIENVEGILRKNHSLTLENILAKLSKSGSHGYNLEYKLLDAVDYRVPQNRRRVFFIGIRKDLPYVFKFPNKLKNKLTLKDAIYDLVDKAEPHDSGNILNENMYLNSDWSSQFMSRNRVRKWDQQAFTVPASGRHVTIHPQAPLMNKIKVDKFEFCKGYESLYRRFTLRECLRIQTFPDDYKLDIANITHGYKIIGNAVPVNLAYHVAKSLKETFD